MERKYDMRICRCGRIHMIENKEIDKALEENKNLLLICGGCGQAILIGADIEPEFDNPDQDCYMMYSTEFSSCDDKIITHADFESTETNKGIKKIMYSHGFKVPMQTGMYATDYFEGEFSDRWYPDFHKINRSDATGKEVMEFIERYNKDRRTVDMKRFIAETSEEFLNEISCYFIRGFNWKDTKWETDFNSR